MLLSSLPLPTSSRVTTPGPGLSAVIAKQGCCHRCHCHHRQCCGCLCCHHHCRRCRCQSSHHPSWLLLCISTRRHLLTAGASISCLFAASCCPPWRLLRCRLHLFLCHRLLSARASTSIYPFMPLPATNFMVHHTPLANTRGKSTNQTT